MARGLTRMTDDSSSATIGPSSGQSLNLTNTLFYDQKPAKLMSFPSALVQPHKAAGVAVDSKPYLFCSSEPSICKSL